MLKKREAEILGKRLLKQMKDKGWKLHIWENLGWHYCITNGPLSIYGDEHGTVDEKDGFSILMCDEPDRAHAGSMLWSLGEGRHSKIPRVILKRQVDEARKRLNVIIAAVEKAERILKNEEGCSR